MRLQRHDACVDFMMPQVYVESMRTTLTLDEDIAAKLQTASRQSGKSFHDVVNETLRRGLAEQQIPARAPFRVKTRDMGTLCAGISLDNTAQLLESIEGPESR